MGYMGTKEAAEKWGVSQTTVAQWCKEGVIDGARQRSPRSPWRIPIDADHPGAYKNTKPCSEVNVSSSINNSLSLIVAECPHCGGELEFKNNKKSILYCPFCGRKLILSETNWTEKTIHINKTTTIDDKAKVARAELSKVKIQAEKRSDNISTIAFAIILVAMCLALAFGS